MQPADPDASRTIELHYFSNERIPGSSACALQQVQMCAAFAQAGAAVRLIRPYYFGLADVESVYRFYGVNAEFRITTLPTLLSLSRPLQPSSRRLPFIGGASMQAMVGLYAMRTFTAAQAQPRVVYCRNVNAAAVITMLARTVLRQAGLRIFYEVHSLDQQPRRWFEYVLRHADGLICITSALAGAVAAAAAVSAERILLAPDAAWPLSARSPLSSAEARRTLGLADLQGPMVVYTGSFKTGKGVEILLQAAGLLPPDVHIFFVGGEADQVQAMRERSRGQSGAVLHWIGFVPPQDARLYHRAADLCVLPNTAEGAWHAYTSPLKMFEYMAAARPIVASDLAVLREVLVHDRNAWLVPPANSAALANAITRILRDGSLAQRLARQAAIDASGHTWPDRAKRIIQFIMQIL